MGGAVAANMKRAGFEVVGYDPSPVAQEAAQPAAAHVAPPGGGACRGAPHGVRDGRAHGALPMAGLHCRAIRGSSTA